MKAHDIGSTKIAALRAGSLDRDRWFGWAALMLLGSVLVYGFLCIPANAETVRAPSRIANVYDGRDHQPTRSEIESRERARGLQPSACKQSSEDAALQRLYERLSQGVGAG